MTAKRSPLNRPTSSWAPVAAETDRHRLLDVLGNAEVRREQVARCLRAGSRAASRSRPSRRSSAAPCRRRPRRRAAPRRPRAHASPASARTGSSAPRSRADRRRPGARAPPQLGQAAAEGLAGVRDDRDLASSRCAPSRRACTATSAHSAAIPMITPPATSIGWCMPRYMREKATNTGISAGDEPDRNPRRAVLDARRQEQREPAVDSDRRRGVARRIARVDRQAARGDARRGRCRWIDERRRAVRSRLDGQREEQETGEPPVLGDGCDHRADAGDDRQDDAAGHDRADERGLGQPARAVPGEKADEALVVARDPVDVKQHVRDDEARDDRERRDRDECDDDAAGRTSRPDGRRRAAQPGGARAAPAPCRGRERRAPIDRVVDRRGQAVESGEVSVSVAMRRGSVSKTDRRHGFSFARTETSASRRDTADAHDFTRCLFLPT